MLTACVVRKKVLSNILIFYKCTNYTTIFFSLQGNGKPGNRNPKTKANEPSQIMTGNENRM